MVMQRGRRVLTVEEARNLLPPSEEELERRRAVLEEILALRAEILRSRGGVPISAEDMEWALLHGDDEARDQGCAAPAG